MFCEKCGKEYADGSNFCPSCGYGVNSNGYKVYSNDAKPVLDETATGIIGYVTFIGWIVAYCLGDRDKAKFHLNQGLVINIFGLLGAIPYIGWAWAIFIWICRIIGIIACANHRNEEVPLLGKIRILN